MTAEQTDPNSAPSERPVCGIVMPISTIDDCSETHWSDVRAIITDAIATAGFSPSLVSDANDIGIIQKRIIQNLYDNPIVVCDVSAKNPNVMFELGMRLAFDKPTIIIKDDKTSYSFDTSPIEHLGYPRDLRYSKILAFKASLVTKIKATHEKASGDPEYTTFLKHFGTFTVARLEKSEVSKEDFIIEQLQEMRAMLIRQEKDAGSKDRVYYVGTFGQLNQRVRVFVKQFVNENHPDIAQPVTDELLQEMFLLFRRSNPEPLTRTQTAKVHDFIRDELRSIGYTIDDIPF